MNAFVNIERTAELLEKYNGLAKFVEFNSHPNADNFIYILV